MKRADTLWHDAANVAARFGNEALSTSLATCTIRTTAMTPGVNRLIALGLFSTRACHAGYTLPTAHLPSFFFDLHLMPTPPRDLAGPRLRWDLIVRVRREIEAGTYETPEKWAIALARLQADLEHRHLESEEQPAW